MAAEDFFTRWSKKKSDTVTAPDAEVAATDTAVHPMTEARSNDEVTPIPDAAVKPLPTQEDVDKLTHDSDYSAFMTQGVDESVKRSAMKKLFTDPHFNIMDGLDIYIDDYNKFEPITPELLASLNHAKALLDPLSQLKTPMMRLLEKIPEAQEQATDGEMPVIGEQVRASDSADNTSPDNAHEKDYAEQQIPQAAEILPDQSIEESSVKNPKAKPDVDDV
ncbi:DUF3306 domain-containing protein [Herminiimonas fonticola]|uniref:Uncharacterized protein DUF3306 n=1 Tax=Herminiimonas fonticola TaxID=303380 RepID=A0A4R6G8T7_9BURK|nr:DUF3306 domain-containing protein [Herminiimonas fonticola]RBA24253.1 Protein of unknown function (DUF3306) [Herminiimonas fonticola]TDN90254.1 uncharacterized protein DUF3306 [Herminiimonas fonticola]